MGTAASESVSARRKPFADFDRLIDRFSFAEYDLRIAAPKRPVVINGGERQRFCWLAVQCVEPLLNRRAPCCDVVEQRAHPFAAH